RRIGAIVAGRRSITADIALRLALFFGTDAQSWMNLQTHYDLAIAEQQLAERLAKEVVRHAA
ncbi:MAG: HigA family addiction module antidote protein, partial [Syntrophaceae bacterium]|nr:HigA family addiction module antidote protein [Syntrophaceae bacterium]